MPSKSKPPPTSITKNTHKTYPRKSKDQYPTTPKPQETKPANISSVRKAPDPGRLLTKDPHPFPVAVSFLRSLHVVPLAQAARLPPSPGLHFPPRPLASPFAPTFGLAIPRPPPAPASVLAPSPSSLFPLLSAPTPPPPLHPFPLPGALPRPASSLLLPPASAPPPPHPAKQTKTILFHHTLKTPPKCPSLRLYTFLIYMNDKNNI